MSCLLHSILSISFVMWCRLSDVSRGIAYSIDKEYEATLEYLTELEPLEEEFEI